MFCIQTSFSDENNQTRYRIFLKQILVFFMKNISQVDSSNVTMRKPFSLSVFVCMVFFFFLLQHLEMDKFIHTPFFFWCKMKKRHFGIIYIVLLLNRSQVMPFLSGKENNIKNYWAFFSFCEGVFLCSLYERYL